jgi:hypothetical protein
LEDPDAEGDNSKINLRDIDYEGVHWFELVDNKFK